MGRHLLFQQGLESLNSRVTPSIAADATFFDFFHTVSEDEIDAQQHVHNLRYLQWTLWAAGRHVDAIGWDTRAALQRGVGWVVREHTIQYRSAAVAGDQIVVRTWVHDMQRFASRRKYVVCRPADQAVLARVETRWVFVDLRHHKALAIPADAICGLNVRTESPPMPWEEES